jgi:hypothetical protein
MACLAVFSLTGCSKSSVTKRAADTPVIIVAADSGFTIPDTLHSGLNHVVYENHGREIHECQFIHLPHGMTTADYVAQVKSGVAFPAGAKDCSGPGLASPGERVEMWVPLEEGNYMIGCWIADHLTTRRPTGFVVHGTPAQPVQPPHEDVTVRMVDFRYDLVGTLARGEQTIRYETVGPSMHEADIIKLADGRTVEDVRAWFKNQERDPLPGTIAGGCMDSHDLARVTWVRRTFTPGRYVFWCDMPMVQNASAADSTVPRVTHADAGMFKEVTID